MLPKTILVLVVTTLVHCTSAENYLKFFNFSQESSKDNGQCIDDLLRMVKGLEQLEPWAFGMVDASTKSLPSGLLKGNGFDLGDYDECLDIQTTIENRQVKGKYCLGVYPITFPTSKLRSMAMKSLNYSKMVVNFKHPHLRAIQGEPQYGIHLAFCVPDSCNAENLENLTQLLTFTDDLCRTKDNEGPLSTGAIVTITLLSIIGVIVVLQTAYDTYLYYSELKPKNEALIAFSVLTNGRKLLATTNNPDQLTCLNGIRALSMIWVVLGHEYSSTLMGPVRNMYDLQEWMTKKENMFIVGATVSVDTFFVLAGLVTVYTFLKSQDKGVKFNLPMYYVHRYLRLTPAVAIMALIYATLLMHLVDGPFINLMVKKQMVQPCRENWWLTLLFVQNYFRTDEMCLGQTWYLAVDTQLFVLSPLVLYPLKKWPKQTLCAIGVLIFGGILSPFLISYFKELSSSMTGDMETTMNLMNSYYYATQARFGPYVIGMLTGYYIYHLKKGTYQIKIPKTYAVPFWILLTVGLVACVYGGYDTMQTGSRLENAFYLAFNRNCWGLGVCLAVIACITGYGGPINTFLSASIFQFIAKLSYSIYLLHGIVMFTRVGTLKTPAIFSDFNTIFEFYGDFMLSLFLSVIFCLLFESPIITLEKVLFGGLTKPKPKTEKKPVV